MIKYTVEGSDNRFLVVGLQTIASETLAAWERHRLFTQWRGEYRVTFICVDALNINTLISRLSHPNPHDIVFVIVSKRLSYFFHHIPFISHVTIIFTDDSLTAIRHKLQSVIHARVLLPDVPFHPPKKPLSSRLTPKEWEVLNLIFDELSGNVIASVLNKSQKTVSAHKRSAMKKLGVTSEVELMRASSFFRNR